MEQQPDESKPPELFEDQRLLEIASRDPELANRLHGLERLHALREHTDKVYKEMSQAAAEYVELHNLLPPQDE